MPDTLNPSAVDSALESAIGKAPDTDVVTISAAELVRLRGAANRVAEAEAASLRYARDNEVQKAIAARTDLAQGAAEVLVKLIRDDLIARRDATGYMVTTDQGRTAAEHVNDFLAAEGSRLFLRAGARPGPDTSSASRTPSAFDPAASDGLSDYQRATIARFKSRGTPDSPEHLNGIWSRIGPVKIHD